MTIESPLGAPFAVLAAEPCPPYDEILVSIEREFRAVDGSRVAEALDDRARPLFELRHAAGRDRVGAVAAAAWDALPRTGASSGCWLAASALDERRAAAPVRACVAVELSRRAGMRARPVRMRGRWFVAIHDHGAPVASDVGPDPVDDVTAPAGCLCPPAVALTVLSGLTAAWAGAGDARRARRAAGLRLLLPLSAETRAKLVDETLDLGEAA